jgi:hypothetical protein
MFDVERAFSIKALTSRISGGKMHSDEGAALFAIRRMHLLADF